MTLARRSRIFALALPIIGGMVSQNVLNLVDSAMVGQLGTAALAAVGVGSFLNFFSNAFLQGFSASVQAMVARRRGEGQTTLLAAPLNAALLIVLCVGVPLSLLLSSFSSELFPLLHDDLSVQAEGSSYYRLRVLALTAVGMNFAFRGFWNGMDQSKRYFRALLVMHAANIVLNYILIFGHLGAPAMGVQGAGLASLLATFVGTATYFTMGLRHASDGGFLKALPSVERVKTLVGLAVPVATMQTFFAGGFVTLFWIIGQVGTAETAAANVLMTVLLTVILPGLGFGLASSTLVGEALGRGDVEDARRWGWQTGRMAFVLMSGLGLSLAIFAESILGVFLKEPEALHLAIVPLRIVGSLAAFDAFGMVMMNSLFGAGANKRVMQVSIVMQWGFMLPCAYFVGVVLGYGLFGIWMLQMSYRLGLALIYTLMWRSSFWEGIRV